MLDETTWSSENGIWKIRLSDNRWRIENLNTGKRSFPTLTICNGHCVYDCQGNIPLYVTNKFAEMAF